MCEAMDISTITLVTLTVAPQYDTNVELSQILFWFNKRDYSFSMSLYFWYHLIIHLLS